MSAVAEETISPLKVERNNQSESMKLSLSDEEATTAGGSGNGLLGSAWSPVEGGESELEPAAMLLNLDETEPVSEPAHTEFLTFILLLIMQAPMAIMITVESMLMPTPLFKWSSLT